MKTIDFSKLSPPDAYKILTGSITPRPIAWVSSRGRDGIDNLAPFSFFTAVCSHPPTILFCPVAPPAASGLTAKDTLRNIRDTGVFVVNIVDETLVEKMNATSAPYPADVSEFDAAGVTGVAADKIDVLRVAESPIQLECRLSQIVPVGDGTAGSGHIVIGTVLCAHLRTDTVNDRLHVDIGKVRPVSRLAGMDYAPVRDVFALERPMAVPKK